MKHNLIIAVSIILCSSFFPVLLICSCVFAEEPRKLSSFETGFFYASVSKGDGVVQQSACKDVKQAALFTGKKLFDCVRDNHGLRCTATGSLDVIFLFKDRKSCEADRRKTLDSDEE